MESPQTLGLSLPHLQARVVGGAIVGGDARRGCMDCGAAAQREEREEEQ